MTHAVASAIADGDHLIVEAGTGVGKSLAYLVPSALHAARNGARTVVSTNTINLQEKLVASDIPLARKILASAGLTPADLRVAQLKGRANYLCLLRWAAARHAPTLTAEEAQVLVRMLFWLARTETGDRAELNLRRNEDAAWRRFSANDASCLSSQCIYVRDGSCFLHRAKKRAEAAHVLVVNHALLLSDIATGGNVLPEYQHLVVDEAHHLEDEATSQFGFAGGEPELVGWLDLVHARASRDRDGGLVASVLSSTRASSQASGAAPGLQALTRPLSQSVASARERVAVFFQTLQSFAQQHGSGGGEYDERIVISRGMRVQPDWAGVEQTWFEADERLAQVSGLVEELLDALVAADPGDVLDRDAIASEAGELIDAGEKLRRNISKIVGEESKDTVCWITLMRRDAAPSLSAAPLTVSETLKTRLFDPKESVVLTSATLSTDGSFEYIKQRLGLEDPQELMLGSPFDYKQSTLILTPSDMPEPAQVGYAASTQTAIIELVRASEGRALVLFTSHAALRTAYNGIKRTLEEQQILVLGQGIDGTPRQLLAALKGSHRTVVLGASSFWEGVDVTGEALSLLIIARLPFSVPSDPVFQARAELFDQPFEQYAVPQAILRFKQGFGRLIRRKTDRGVMVVLDRRLRSKQYGVSFLRSLPSCTLREMPLREMHNEVAAWLARPAPSPEPASGATA
jgi:DNA polymerase-3 subunit epsilon/ATP-dependent DNA helicase DinG